jgi:hypothetical protein
LRARRESYYTRPEADRRRDSHRMAQDVRGEREKDRARGSKKEVRRDGTVRRKKKKDGEDGLRDEYVYGRHRSMPVGGEPAVRRSSGIRRSEGGGGSSSRTEHTPLSGSRSTSVRKEEPRLGRSMSARDPQRVYQSRLKLPGAIATPLAKTNHGAPKDTRKSSGLLATLFKPSSRPQTAVAHKEIPRFVSPYTCRVCQLTIQGGMHHLHGRQNTCEQVCKAWMRSSHVLLMPQASIHPFRLRSQTHASYLLQRRTHTPEIC